MNKEREREREREMNEHVKAVYAAVLRKRMIETFICQNASMKELNETTIFTDADFNVAFQESLRKTGILNRQQSAGDQYAEMARDVVIALMTELQSLRNSI